MVAAKINLTFHFTIFYKSPAEKGNIFSGCNNCYINANRAADHFPESPQVVMGDTKTWVVGMSPFFYDGKKPIVSEDVTPFS